MFVDETGPKERRVKRLAHHGSGRRQCALSHARRRSRAHAAVFAVDAGNHLHVLSARAIRASICYNIETGQREIVGNFPGMSFSPRFSPDGQRVIMSLQEGGNSNLFVMDLRSKATTRLTDTQAIDTAPSYSPDGSRICFESDRGGKQQIYVMAATGGAAQRISFGDGAYSTPVWSPRGDYIAFTKHGAGQICHRHHEARRIRRAHPHRRLSQRRADLVAERARDHVFPRSGRQCRTVAVFRWTSPAATSSGCRRRAMRPIRPGRRFWAAAGYHRVAALTAH